MGNARAEPKEDGGGEMPRALEPQEAWARLQRGEARLLDLRTGFERRRYGAPTLSAAAGFASRPRSRLELTASRRPS